MGLTPDPPPKYTRDHVPTLWPPGHRYGGSVMLKGEREAWEAGFKAGQDDAARQIREALKEVDSLKRDLAILYESPGGL